MPDHRRALASMGIYVFSAGFLYEQLIRDADARLEPRFRQGPHPYAVARGIACSRTTSGAAAST